MAGFAGGVGSHGCASGTPAPGLPGLQNCLPGHRVAPVEEGEQAKAGLVFGAWGSKRLVGWAKRQPAKSEVPSLGHAEPCLHPAIPWGPGVKREWLNEGR